MPLTPIQYSLAKLLARNRSEESHLAGASGFLANPHSHRFSADLDFFHASEEAVALAFAADRNLMEGQGYKVTVQAGLPGFMRAFVEKAGEGTKIEWSRDSIWRFMPVQKSEEFGFQLHPIDLATNKVLALVGREAVRDYFDVLYLHETLLPLGPLAWAASSKDPGFTPYTIAEMLKRRGKVKPEDLDQVNFVRLPDLGELKLKWLEILDQVDAFVRSRPKKEMGCLYYSPSKGAFVDPGAPGCGDAVPHYASRGGVIPSFP